MKKRIISFLLCVCLLGSSFMLSAEADFSDVSDDSLTFEIAVLQSMGIVDGYDDGSFHPNEILTRAQFSKMAVMAMELGDQVSSAARKTLYTDAPGGQWYSGYINLASTQGIVSGYGNGTFGPDDSVSYAQAITILLRVLGYSSSQIGSLWPSDYIRFADAIGLTEGVISSENAALTRSQAVHLMFNMLRMDTADGRSYASGAAESYYADALILSNTANADDGTPNCVKFYYNGSTLYCKQAYTLPDELIGASGTVLLNSAGKICGFIPQSKSSISITASAVTSGKITASNGTKYTISGNAALIWQGNRYAYSTGYVNINSNSVVRLFFDEAGNVITVYLPSAGTGEAVMADGNTTVEILNSLVEGLGVSGDYSILKNGTVADRSDLAKYDVASYDASLNALLVSDVRITGAIEAAYPSLDAPSTVTVAGTAYSVLDSAKDDFSSLRVGRVVTLLLTCDGSVAAASTNAKYRADMIGVLSKNGDRYTVTLTSGQTLTGSVSKSVEDRQIGNLVRVTSSAAGKLTLSALGNSECGGTLSLDKWCIGNTELAPSAVFYEWAGAGCVTKITVADLAWTDEVASSAISYVHLNSAGQADIILLNDVTGASYTYGLATIGQGNASLSNVSTLTVTNSDGSIGPLNGTGNAKNNMFIGVAKNGANSTVKTISLKSADVARSDFQGKDSVLLSGTQYRIADNVQVYHRITGTWYSDSAEKGSALEQALASSDTITVYYDRTASTGGQIRIVAVS